MTDKSIDVIQLGIIYIKNNSMEGLRKVLMALPLEKLGKQADELFSLYLSVCAGYDRVDAAKEVLEAWKVIYPEEENIQILSKLFLWNNINLPTLSFVILSHDDYTYIELMDDLIIGDSSPNVTTACSKADEIFGPQPYETYKIVNEHAIEMENYRVEEYTITWMEQTAPYAPIPEWVQNYSGDPLVTNSELEASLAKLEEVSFQLPPDEEAVNLLTAGLSQNGVSVEDIEQVREYLLAKLSVSTRKEKIQLLRPIIENQAEEILYGDKVLFRIFGPANPLVNQDLTLKTVSSKYGGCRMFLCDIFDYDEDFDYVYDWFNGACDECHLRIREKWHAVRKPRHAGGWTGSYCSWKCVRDSLMTEGQEPNLLIRELINIFEKQIKEIGIQDRLADSNNNNKR
jgi:hypothetical protein